MEQTPEQKKQRIELLAKVAIGGAICVAASTIVVPLIGGMVGLAVAAAIGYAGLQFTPYFAMKVANMRMALITGEARKNPIETMNNIYLEQMNTIHAKTQKIVQFQARLEDFKVKVVDLTKKYPADAVTYQNMVKAMSDSLVRRKDKQKIAIAAARVYHDQIERGEAIWAVAVEARGLQQLDESEEKKVFNKIRTSVAFDEITHTFNTAVAQLSVEADIDPEQFTDSDQKQLPEGTSTPMPQARILDAEVVSRS